MNVKQTQAVIRALDMTCVRINGEWCINYPLAIDAAHPREATAYYTTDNQDALDTAKAMIVSYQLQCDEQDEQDEQA